jgi:cobalt-zinc-cadmium efflux system membrane fusion protein
MRPLQPTAVLLGLLVAAACRGKEGDAAPEKTQAVVGASVATVEAARFTESVDAVGAVVPRMGHVASLAAPAPTRVSNVFVTVGARVAKGDALVEFEQAPFDAASKSADATLSAAQKAAERAQRLADAGVLPKKEAESAASELAQAQLNAVNAKRSRELSTLRAPIAGVVTRMSAVLGASADASQAVVEVADPTALDVVLTLSPSDAARVRVGMSVALHAASDAAGKPVATGRVADVAAAVDTSSRGVTARVEVTSGNAALRIGQSLFGRIAVGEHANAVIVPLEALVPDGEGFKVFVVDTAGIAHARPVKLGGRSDSGAWVREGLKAGERVVTKGAYGVDDSAKVVPETTAEGRGQKAGTTKFRKDR